MPRVRATVSHPHRRGFLRYGINGRYREVPLDKRVWLDPEAVEHLRSLGATVEEASGRAGPSQEGSGGGPALSPAFLKFDHNKDGRPGGSKPGRRKTTKKTPTKKTTKKSK